MSHTEGDNEALLRKFWQLYRIEDGQKFSARGGIFSTSTRERLLRIKRQSGRGRTKNEFWCDTRTYVKTTLLDLQLFLDTASISDRNQVVTREALAGVLDSLFPRFSKPNSMTVKIAQLFIEKGFQYLRDMNRQNIPPKYYDDIRNAIDLSKHLTLMLLPEDEREQFQFVPQM